MNTFIGDSASSKIITTVDRKGRAIIPASIRKRYSLSSGLVRLSVYRYIFDRTMDSKGRISIPKAIREKKMSEDAIIVIDSIMSIRRGVLR